MTGCPSICHSGETIDEDLTIRVVLEHESASVKSSWSLALVMKMVLGVGGVIRPCLTADTCVCVD